MINKLWALFIFIGVFTFLLTGNIEGLNSTILSCGQKTFDMVIKIFPVIALWLGIMEIANASGLLKKISNIFYPILKILFPEIPKENAALGFISSNIITNMFGLGNAATPFGLKAMKELQKLNNKKEVATRSMITFLVINTSGVTILPTTVISLRMMYESKNPQEIIPICILTTLISLILAIIIDKIFASRCKNG